jgi:plasmid stabilization system protein ParE
VKRLIWSPRSIRDLESIHEHIAQDSPLYADLVVQRLIRAPDRLQHFSESGRSVPELGQPELRELIVRPLRAVYRIGGDPLEIVTVFCASRLFPDIGASAPPNKLPIHSVFQLVRGTVWRRTLVLRSSRGGAVARS